MRFQVLRRFQIGFVWRFLWHLHAAREALPDAVALARGRSTASVPPVGQDSNLVVRRILNDTMEILFHDPPQSQLAHVNHHVPLAICHLPYPTPSSAIRNWVRFA